MARGAAAKARKKDSKAADRQGDDCDSCCSGGGNFESNYFGLSPDELSGAPVIQGDDVVRTKMASPESDGSDDEIRDGDGVELKIRKGRKREKKRRIEEAAAAEGGYFSNIKLLPLLFLLMLTGTTLLPAGLWVLDNAGPILGKSNLTGKLGYRLGIGSTPRKRLESFYEKHSPEKLSEADAILSKYYGNYKALTKKLERKYHDYGYFLGWEDDEAPSALALEQIGVHYSALKSKVRSSSPRSLTVAYDNACFNLSNLKRRATRVWVKKIWPILRPIVYVPSEKEAKRQKMEDRKKYGGGRGRGGNEEEI